ncbi:hypothetical protein JKF63_06269 [Porcisia hertigi]|uniref:Uncharacterized protein n=1 Tax=Porcisia hertigi TaxID=2761500 RepID=A0A836ICI9_9TRYP|nr:hypothetical protein JKF63_06269 [Porcisia hertigi]
MLRRTSLRLTLFSSAGGSAPRSRRPSAGTDTDAAAPESTSKTDGLYLPWTARPWAVTYRVHYSQWKFVDTVFAHLATVAPAVLNEHAQQQGVRDVLCELEEPAVALRRRQARQLRKQKTVAADATCLPPQMPTPAFQGTATTVTASPTTVLSCRVIADNTAASETSAKLESVPNVATTPETHEAVDRHAALLNASKELKGNRKSKKTRRKPAMVIHDL